MKRRTTTTTEEFDEDGYIKSRTVEETEEEDDQPIQQWPPVQYPAQYGYGGFGIPVGFPHTAELKAGMVECCCNSGCACKEEEDLEEYPEGYDPSPTE